MRKNWVKKKKNGEKNLSEHLKWYETSREAKKKKEKVGKKIEGDEKKLQQTKKSKNKSCFKIAWAAKTNTFPKGGLSMDLWDH